MIALATIQRTVAAHFDLPADALLGRTRHKTVALARHLAMYFVRHRTGRSFPEIGRAFGGRDHTTVINAVRKIEAQRDTDLEVRLHVEALEEALVEPRPTLPAWRPGLRIDTGRAA